MGPRVLGVAGVAICIASAVSTGVLWPPEVSVPPVRDHVFRNVTLVEPGLPRVPGATLVLSEGRIAAAGSDDPAGVTGDEDFEGFFALPGLVDLHVHHPPRIAIGGRELFGLLFLAHGVTTVRDTGSLWGSALELADAAERGDHPSPRVFSCGPFLSGTTPEIRGMRLVEDAEDARVAVSDLSEEGVSCIKIHNGLSRESVLALIEEANRVGLPIVAHVPAAVSLQDLAGAEVQHTMKLTPSWSRVRHDAVEKYVRLSIAAGLTHTPTLVVFEQVALRAEGDDAPGGEAARWLPRYIREVLWNPDLNPTVTALDQASGRDPRERTRVMQELVAALHEAGVRLHVGTDTPNPGVVPGESVHQELSLLRASGLSLEEAWIAATRAAGEALRVAKLGTLEPGAPADVLIFREDPTLDLAALSTLEAVIVGGRLYRKSELDAALERHRAHFAGSLYDGLSEFLSRVLLRIMAPPGTALLPDE